MDTHQDNQQVNSMESSASPFQSLQEETNAFQSLQMLTSTQPTLADSISSMGSHYIPLTTLPLVSIPQVATSEVVASEVIPSQSVNAQPELMISEEALFRNYVSQLQSLTSLQSSLQPLQSALVMTSQDSPIPAQNPALVTSSESTQQPPINSPQLATLTPSQFMLVSSSQLLPIASSSQVTMTTSAMAVTSSSLTEAASSELLTLSTPQLTNIMPQSSSHLQTIPSPTDMPLAPPQLEEAPNQETMATSQLSSPLVSLVLPASSQQNLLEVAGREIREGEADQELPTHIGGAEKSSIILDKVLGLAGLEKQETALSSLLGDDGEYLETITNDWSSMFKGKINAYFGYVNTLQEAEQVLKVYELCTDSKFLSVKRCDQSNFQVDIAKGRPFRYTSLVICGHKLPFDGVPYYHGGKGLYYCHLGSKRKPPPKRGPLKNPQKCVHSKKVGCLARVAFRVVARFPEYKLKENTEHHRLIASQTLSKALKEGKEIAVEWRVYVMLPKATAHTNHEVIPKLRLREAPLDRRVIGRICQLVKMGLRDTATIHKQVLHFVDSVLSAEGTVWRSRKDICGSRQVWWYRKQVLDLMNNNTLETSKFMEMIREVEELAQKHNYTGFVDDGDLAFECGDAAKQVGGKWKMRTALKKQKCYEQQVKTLKVESFGELECITKYIQSCTQAEVLARLLSNIKSARETFERELNIDVPFQPNGMFQVPVEAIKFEQTLRAGDIVQTSTVLALPTY